MNSSFRQFAFLSVVGSMVALPAFAWAGTRRADVSDQQYLDLAAQARYDAVGRVTVSNTGGGGGAASGMFIGFGNGGGWLLTAAHVLTVGQVASATFTFGGNTYGLDVSTLTNPTGWTVGVNDFALVRITGLASTPIAPAGFADSLVPITANLAQRTIGTSVGFGDTGTGLTGNTSNDGRKRAFRNRIDANGMTVTGSGFFPGYLADFDDSTAFNNTLDLESGVPVSSTSARGWDALEGNVAPGDSGGGLFADVNGHHILVGVTSYVVSLNGGHPYGRYGDYSGWSPIGRSQADWITANTGIAAVPEPATMLVLGAGLAALAARRRRR